MNKNYKQNLKTRNIKTTKKPLDIKEYIVKNDSELLEYLLNNLGFSRSNAKKLLSNHLISINGAPVSQFNFKLIKGDTLIISKHPIRQKKRTNLPIIYEDDEFIAINKPAGLLSVASDKEKNVTAYRLVMDYVQQEDKHNRIYGVHRIDKETSGVLLFSKSQSLAKLLQDKWIDLAKTRKYMAVCEGTFKEKSKHIENYLKESKVHLMYIADDKVHGQKCITEYKVIKENDKYSLVDVEIFTGRKNQIRVTLGGMGHFVLGDDKYGEPANPINRLCLHAYKLCIVHPITKKLIELTAPVPKEFKELVS